MAIQGGSPASATVAAQVDRARRFLRDIRDAVARHPVAAKRSEIVLHERREPGVSTLRLSAIVDGLPVQMFVRVRDDAPARPTLEYCPLLQRLRTGELPSVAALAFNAAHDEACSTHYPDSESWRQTLRLAMRQARVLRGSLH